MEEDKKITETVKKSEEFDKEAKEKEKAAQMSQKEDGVAETVEDNDSDVIEIKLDADSRKKSLEESRAIAAAKYKKDRKKRTIKKIIKWVVIVAVLCLAAWIGVNYLGYTAQQKLSGTDRTQTGVVERMDLSDTISTTGTVQSKDTRTVTSALNGVTISKVNYEVGDMVNEGDVIVEFSRDDIQDSIDQAEEDLAEAKKNESLTNEYKASQHEYDYGTASYSNYTASTKTQSSSISLARAQEDLDQACQDKSKYVEKYEIAVANIGFEKQKLEDAQVYLSLFQTTNQSPINEKTSSIPDAFPNGVDFGDGEVINYLGYQYTLSEFNNYINDLKTLISDYESTIKNYDTQITSYDQKINSAQRSLADAQKSYSEQVNSELDTNRQTANNIVTSDYNYNSYVISAGDKVTQAERTLKQQQDKLDDYIVYAPISGLVTSVSAQEGNGYVNTSGGLMTIQAIDTFEVTTQIDEYDINSVALGQRVVIMTDATGDDEIEGQISFISPIATTSSSSSSGSQSGQSSSSGNTYEVKIDILSTDSRIKLGMSAKLNIIVDQHKNILAVPYDAVEETDDGEHYVMVLSGANKPSGAPSVNAGSNNGDSPIMVVGTDGEVTGTPEKGERPEMPDGDFPGAPSKNESGFKGFIKYLFSSKEQEKSNDTGLSSAGKKVMVDIGIEGDYYTEITSSEISEGNTVILNSDSDTGSGMFMPGMGGGMGGGPNGPGGF